MDSSVSKTTGYRLDIRNSIPDKGKGVYILHNVQTGFEANPAFYRMVTGGYFTGGGGG
jgi:hypothetical protein